MAKKPNFIMECDPKNEYDRDAITISYFQNEEDLLVKGQVLVNSKPEENSQK